MRDRALLARADVSFSYARVCFFDTEGDPCVHTPALMGRATHAMPVAFVACQAGPLRRLHLLHQI
jgi:hypothetical protein